MQAEDKDGIMATMTHIRDVRKKAPMVTGLFGPLTVSYTHLTLPTIYSV